jgi:hypothetical protein
MVDEDVKDPIQIRLKSNSSTKLKYCCFRLAGFNSTNLPRVNKTVIDCVNADLTTPVDVEGVRTTCEQTVGIINTTTPLVHQLVDTDEFELQYNRDSKLLTLSNNRGFSFSKKHSADESRFFIKVAGFGVSILENRS